MKHRPRRVNRKERPQSAPRRRIRAYGRSRRSRGSIRCARTRVRVRVRVRVNHDNAPCDGLGAVDERRGDVDQRVGFGRAVLKAADVDRPRIAPALVVDAQGPRRGRARRCQPHALRRGGCRAVCRPQLRARWCIERRCRASRLRLRLRACHGLRSRRRPRKGLRSGRRRRLRLQRRRHGRLQRRRRPRCAERCARLRSRFRLRTRAHRRSRRRRRRGRAPSVTDRVCLGRACARRHARAAAQTHRAKELCLKARKELRQQGRSASITNERARGVLVCACKNARAHMRPRRAAQKCRQRLRRGSA